MPKDSTHREVVRVGLPMDLTRLLAIIDLFKDDVPNASVRHYAGALIVETPVATNGNGAQ